MKRKELQPTPEFTKDHKYFLIRRYSLLVAAIPGLVLLPMLIAMAIDATSLPKEVKNVIDMFGILTMFALMPAMLAMAGLVILAIITATQKPTNLEAPTPRTKQLQIALAAIAAAMPTIAFLDIFRYGSNECSVQTSCFIFDAPMVTPTGIAYAALWILLATIWLRTKKANTNTPN